MQIRCRIRQLIFTSLPLPIDRRIFGSGRTIECQVRINSKSVFLPCPWTRSRSTYLPTISNVVPHSRNYIIYLVFDERLRKGVNRLIEVQWPPTFSWRDLSNVYSIWIRVYDVGMPYNLFETWKTLFIYIILADWEQ